VIGTDDLSSQPAPARHLHVGEVMGPVVTVSTEATLREVARRMLETDVQGVVVIDARDNAIGLITERQLAFDERHLTLACLKIPEIGGRSASWLDGVDAACMAATTLTARDVMEKYFPVADAEEPLGALVDRMNRRESEFALIQQRGEVVGLLGRRDLLRRVAGEPACAPMLSMRAHIKSAAGRRSLLSWLTNGH
jgi:CBS domain-containing protein